MDSFTAMPPASAAGHLPAQRIDAAGRTHVDQRAVLALALPLMANSAVQIVLNLTDMWFMGRISTRALAAVGAVQWLVDRKSTRLNSSHRCISYAVCCLKKTRTERHVALMHAR